MTQPLFIYVHGFNSSPQSMKAQLLREVLSRQGLEQRLRVPALSHWPAQAIEQLVQEIGSADGPVTLIGSSLGGYYSTWLVEHAERFSTQLNAVLVNPAVYPYRLLEAWLGENQNLYTAENYQLTEQHLQQLLALNCDSLRDPSRYLVLLQTGDETLDYREACDKYGACEQFIQPGGSHGFEQFERLIPSIQAFAEGRLDLPDAVELPVGAN